MVLCGHLGMTLGELGQRMSAQEFALWCARHAQVPIGEVRDDLNTGILAAQVTNMAGKILKGKPTSASDFMPSLNRPNDEPDPLEFFGKM
jgi:hypothetical protein